MPKARQHFVATVPTRVTGEMHRSRKSVPAEALSAGSYGGNQAALRRLSPTSPRVQCKLTIGAVNDPLEAEADRIAEHVMRMPDSGPSVTAGAVPGTLYRAVEDDEVQALDQDMPVPGEELQSPRPVEDKIQRMCSSCEGDDEKKIQRKEAAGSAPSTSSPEAILQEPGSRLDPQAQAFFERRFGRGFAQVRVHTGAEADESARSVSALAYTVGPDIVFRQDQYQPGTPDGKRLLAHELAHVVQQGAAGKGTPDPGRSQGPIRAQAAASGRLLQRWGVYDPVAGINTIVCDGAGGITTQLGGLGTPGQAACLRDCMEAHEQSHRSDALAEKVDICKDSVAGRTVRPNAGAQRNATEIRASNVEIGCLRGKQPAASDTCKPILSARITQMEGYRDSFK